jgi:hypothetical protein
MNQAGGTKCLKALIWLGYHRTGAANGKSPLTDLKHTHSILFQIILLIIRWPRILVG